MVIDVTVLILAIVFGMLDDLFPYELIIDFNFFPVDTSRITRAI